MLKGGRKRSREHPRDHGGRRGSPAPPNLNLIPFVLCALAGACITDPSSCSDDDDALPVAERSPMGQLKARLTHRMRRHTVAN